MRPNYSTNSVFNCFGAVNEKIFHSLSVKINGTYTTGTIVYIDVYVNGILDHTVNYDLDTKNYDIVYSVVTLGYALNYVELKVRSEGNINLYYLLTGSCKYFFSTKKVASGSSEANRTKDKVFQFHSWDFAIKKANTTYPINSTPWVIPIGYRNVLYRAKLVGLIISIFANKTK
jgi:hypothetical protein